MRIWRAALRIAEASEDDGIHFLNWALQKKGIVQVLCPAMFGTYTKVECEAFLECPVVPSPPCRETATEQSGPESAPEKGKVCYSIYTIVSC